MEKLLLSSSDSDKIWQSSLDRIRRELSEQTFKVWIEPLKLAAYDGATATIQAPDKFYAEWIREHFQVIIRDALFQATGEKIQLVFSIHPAGEREPLEAPKRPAPPADSPRAPHGSSLATPKKDLNSKYTFEDFVIGPGNRLAHAAAVAISDSPARIYNPFFIYGSVGLGKTHLMQGIAHRILSRSPERRVCFISSEKFTNELILAIQSRSTPAFRNRYRSVDVLLIDDIHFIAGKESTQEEFFHTFNALFDAHKQIVVTSDRPPREIPGLEERLISRFGWGLVCDVQPPDFETRVAILKKKMEKETVAVPDEVVHFIAKKIKSNIRELEGALIRVVACSSLTGAAVDLKLAQEILKDSCTEEQTKITISAIQKIVADYFGVKVSDLSTKSRAKSVTLPRQVAMYLVREMTSYSLPEIGDYFGGRNHATVIHACQKIKGSLEKNQYIRQAVESSIHRLRSDSY
ncbi:MAG: chromosomal replication initiator protein DnaA [Candidatus Omnitrophica bacterium]|nr:chromosomal replication initiator protein DnaA [Candidatus Omnitrophota bacterium]